MAVPTWHEFMGPILRVMTDGQIRDRSEITRLAADDAGVTEAERAVTLTTGQPRYANRIGWAISHLTKAGALTRPERGSYVINDAGHTLLATYPAVTRRDVETVTGYRRPRPTATKADFDDMEAAEALDPSELIDQGIKQIHDDVASQLLTRLHGKAPAFFERAVVQLLVAMGYGGAEGRAIVTPQSNDSGIDGIIDQDALGLSRIYVQAKRYAPDNAVGRPEIQAFVGALAGNQAGQGVFITTGRFSAGAREYAEAVPTRVVLIDGQRMASLMIRYGVGVQVKQTLHIVDLDEDFFE